MRLGLIIGYWPSSGPPPDAGEQIATDGVVASGESAVDRDHLPGDVAGPLGAEEGDGGRHLRRPARAAQRDRPHQLGPDVLRDAGRQGRVHQSGRDAVHGDALGAHLARERAAQAHEAGLGGRIVRLTPPPHQRRRRDQIDDAAPSPSDHARQRRARHQESASEVHRQHVVEIPIRGLEEQAVAREPGGMDDDVDRADAREEFRHLGSAARVAPRRGDRQARRAPLVDGDLRRRVVVGVGRDDVDAVSREGPDDGAPEPAAPSRHERSMPEIGRRRPHRGQAEATARGAWTRDDTREV